MPNTGAASSSEYRIIETDEARKALARLGPQRFLRGKLDAFVYPQLRRCPHFGPNIRRLRDWEPPMWRYRIGSYRVFYTIDDDAGIVAIVTIEARKDAYR